MPNAAVQDNVTTTGHADVREANGQQPLIRLRGVVKTYETAAGGFTALNGIDTDLFQGEFVAVIGKSGSGKSTLINMITGIDRPTAGAVYVQETPIHQLTEAQLTAWRGRSLGVVFQFFQLLPMLTLVENVMLPMDFCNVYEPAQRKKRAMELLEQVELADHADKLPTAISGGQQQRVAIARALANDPLILVADEPTGNLDSTTSESVFRMFEEFIAQRKTVVMVTHDSSQARRATRTILIADGEIVNTYVARALPSLTHQQMLHATHNLQPVSYKPGEVILRQGAVGSRFYIVTKGVAEVALNRPAASDVVVARFGVGEYFGEIELLRGGTNIASIRASLDAPVEVVTLDRQTFLSLLDESEGTRAAIAQMAETRVAENIAARGGQAQ